MTFSSESTARTPSTMLVSTASSSSRWFSMVPMRSPSWCGHAVHGLGDGGDLGRAGHDAGAGRGRRRRRPRPPPAAAQGAAQGSGQQEAGEPGQEGEDQAGQGDLQVDLPHEVAQRGQGDRGPHDEAVPAVRGGRAGTATYMRWWPRVALNRVEMPVSPARARAISGRSRWLSMTAGILLGIADHPAVGQDHRQAGRGDSPSSRQSAWTGPSSPAATRGAKRGRPPGPDVLELVGGAVQKEAAHGPAGEPGHQDQGGDQDHQQGREEGPEQACRGASSVTHLVADAADGPDQGAGPAELAPQGGDLDVHRTAGDGVVVAVDRLDDLAAGEDPAGPGGQEGGGSGTRCGSGRSVRRRG